MISPIIRGNKLDGSYLALSPFLPSISLKVTGSELILNMKNGSQMISFFLSGFWTLWPWKLHLKWCNAQQRNCGKQLKILQELKPYQESPCIKVNCKEPEQALWRWRTTSTKKKSIYDNLTLASSPIRLNDLIMQTLSSLDTKYDPLLFNYPTK